jgi:glyoxylase I family protein
MRPENASRSADPQLAPTGLHHHAYVTADQERTRHFYEDLMGLPLTAFWIEDEIILGERHVFSHAFYGLRSGGALAFFNFADPTQQTRYAAKQQALFVHLALKTTRQSQTHLRRGLEAAGFNVWEADHGYTYSIYVSDPNGLLIELSADPDDVEAIDARQREGAHAALAGWMAGRREPNNNVRHG